MREELDQFERNKIRTLIERSKNCSVIGTKWVFWNKLDKHGKCIPNKARLGSQGYSRQEGIDYDETFASMASLESIRILLAYACCKRFKLFQMNVKRVFLNGL